MYLDVCTCVHVYIWCYSHYSVLLGHVQRMELVAYERNNACKCACYTHSCPDALRYSIGNELVVYETSIHVLPTVPSPTTTHLMTFTLSAMATMYGILQNCVLQTQSVVGVS